MIIYAKGNELMDINDIYRSADNDTTLVLARSAAIPKGIYYLNDQVLCLRVKKRADCRYAIVSKPNAFPESCKFIYNIGGIDEIEIAEAQRRSAEVIEALNSDSILPDYVEAERNRVRVEFSRSLVTKIFNQIEKLKAHPIYKLYGEIEFIDAGKESPGLLLWISTKNKATFYYTYKLKRADGGWGDHKFKLGEATKKNLEETRELMALAIAYVQQYGRKPPKNLKKIEGALTLRQLHEEYLNEKTKYGKAKAPSTLRQYHNLFQKISSDIKIITNHKQRKYAIHNLDLADRDFTQIGHDEVVKLHDLLTMEAVQKNEGTKRSSTGEQADKVIIYIKSLVRMGNAKLTRAAKNEKSFTFNPADGIRLNVPNKNKSRHKKAIPSEWIFHLMQANDGLREYYNQASEENSQLKNTHTPVIGYTGNSIWFEFMYFTGFRPEDSATIKWSQVDFERRQILWREGDKFKTFDEIKGRHESEILVFPMSKQVYDILKIQKERIEAKKQQIVDRFNNTIKNIRDTMIPNEPHRIEWWQQRIRVNEDKMKQQLATFAGDQYVFVNALFDNHIKVNPSTYLKELRRLSGYEKITAGAFRHTFQQQARKCGLTQGEIRRLVFHTDDAQNISERYTASDVEDRLKNGQRVANRLSRLKATQFDGSDSSYENFISINGKLVKEIENATKESENFNANNNEYLEQDVETVAVEMIRDFLYILKDDRAKEIIKSINGLRDDRDYEYVL